MKISKKQRQLLEEIYESEKTSINDVKMPLYIYNVSSNILYSFLNYSSQIKWFENLQERGLITFRDKSFLNLTDLGRELVTK